jgi:hypothetical protein
MRAVLLVATVFVAPQTGWQARNLWATCHVAFTRKTLLSSEK